MVMDDELQSQPCLNIHYAYDEALEGLGCSELLGPVQNHTILVYIIQ